MLIENNIEDGIDFFHMNALSSAVALKVNCDLQLTLMASSLYRLLAVRIAQSLPGGSRSPGISSTALRFRRRLGGNIDHVERRNRREVQKLLRPQPVAGGSRFR